MHPRPASRLEPSFCLLWRLVLVCAPTPSTGVWTAMITWFSCGRWRQAQLCFEQQSRQRHDDIRCPIQRPTLCHWSGWLPTLQWRCCPSFAHTSMGSVQ